MDNKAWGELLKYSTPDSIWVVTWKNKLLELKCPFRVCVLYNIGDLAEGNIEKVEKVKISSAMVTVFVIEGKAYYYYHFRILLE